MPSRSSRSRNPSGSAPRDSAGPAPVLPRERRVRGDPAQGPVDGSAHTGVGATGIVAATFYTFHPTLVARHRCRPLPWLATLCVKSR